MLPEHTQLMPGTFNLSAKVYADLRLKLIIGDLKPGETLSIRTLAEEYDHGSMPVREALRQLSFEGALVGEAKKAYRVPDLSPNEAAKLFYVRAALEGASAEIATKTVEKKDIKYLSLLSSKMDGAWKVNNAGKFLENNFLFHSHIYAMANNSVLEKMAENLYIRTGPWLAKGIKNLSRSNAWEKSHDGIIDALSSRDSVLARRLIEEDSSWGKQLYQEQN
jgi:DNA-binding GntR family transcriptional regulator